MKSAPSRHIAKATERGARFRRRVVRERRGLQQAGQDRFRRALEGQFDELVGRAIDGRDSVAAAAEAARQVPVPSDGLSEEMERFYVEAGVRFGEIGLEHLKGVARVYVTKQEDQFRRRAQEYLDEIGAEKVTQISETTRQDLVTILQTAVEDGVGIDEVKRRITDTLPQLTSTRATTIARTEIIPASNAAVDAGAREAGIPLDKEWITAVDGRERDAHRVADGSIVDMDEPFRVMGEDLKFPGDTSFGASAANVINCFTTEQLVGTPLSDVNASFRAPYQGPLYRVELSNGHTLSVTPNHPVLTRSGWRSVDSLDEGDKVVKSSSLNRVKEDFDVVDRPSTIKQITHSLSDARASMRMSGSVVNFYGDRPAGDVDVVWADRFLENGAEPFTDKSSQNAPLSLPNLRESLLLRDRASVGSITPILFSLLADSFVGSLGVLKVLFLRALLHHHLIRLGVAPTGNIMLVQDALDRFTRNIKSTSKSVGGFPIDVTANDLTLREVNAAVVIILALYASRAEASVNRGGADPKIIGDFVCTFPTAVSFCDVVNIEVQSHVETEVYTLETTTGLYDAGGVVVRNCRCAHAPIPKDR